MSTVSLKLSPQSGDRRHAPPLTAVCTAMPRRPRPEPLPALTWNCEHPGRTEEGKLLLKSLPSLISFTHTTQPDFYLLRLNTQRLGARAPVSREDERDLWVFTQAGPTITSPAHPCLPTEDFRGKEQEGHKAHLRHKPCPTDNSKSPEKTAKVLETLRGRKRPD